MSQDFSNYDPTRDWYFKESTVAYRFDDATLESSCFRLDSDLLLELVDFGYGLGEEDDMRSYYPFEHTFKIKLPTFQNRSQFLSFNDYTASVNKLTMQQQTPSSQNVFSTSFRDSFILNYHQNIFNKGLTSFSDNSNKIITKDTFDFICSFFTVKYLYDQYSKNTGVEGFVDDHTYFRITHSVKENLYYLNSVFSSNQEFINPILEKLVFLQKPPSVSWVTGISKDGDLIIDRIPLECPELMDKSFYPWLGENLSVEEYIDSYLSGNESILLLYGIPGSGKSNLLKYLLYRSGESALITYQDSIRDLDVMFSNFITGPNKFLIIEDADEFLVKREQGNTSMKRLLNIADGLTSNKDKKIIFTTNISSLSSIDEALIRDGRCFDTIKFDKLTKQEALSVADYLEISKELIEASEYTLAQLFAIKNNKLKRRISTKSSSFGFGNK